MNSENTAGSILGDFVDCAPQARYVRRSTMQADHNEIDLMIAKKLDDGFAFFTFEKMGHKINTVS